MNVRKLQKILQIIFSIFITDRCKVQDIGSLFSHCFAFLMKKLNTESSALAHNIENKTN